MRKRQKKNLSDWENKYQNRRKDNAIDLHKETGNKIIRELED